MLSRSYSLARPQVIFAKPPQRNTRRRHYARMRREISGPCDLCVRRSIVTYHQCRLVVCVFGLRRRGGERHGGTKMYHRPDAVFSK